ncbi:phosphopyruvate hydratase [Bifidobacterium psychraerophilum]|uniref:Enolase n=1 Tax=Bifidobacterium psychraerophilum TaxID=218140 RepID=A0A087CCT8_9BIFI|nr:phosphopyruvate hydratase [Bifidobacterium psychraerophilum]KFI81088.1 phosphopyruvate hydratase [Bifidobacterium psychraerophilum]PKA95431.1 enolase [Bifidobacterium psychraerophilum DSM 22366]
MDTTISHIHARQILDSRGNPTLEVEMVLDDGSFGLGSVPSGASTGENEANEKRDGDKRFYGGKGVQSVVDGVNGEISKAVIGLDASDQRGLDETLIDLDGTENKSRLGANAILGVSLAALHASASSSHLPLYRYIGGTDGHIIPVTSMNVLNGGVHATSSNVDIQEFMFAPVGFDSYHDALRANVESYHALKQVLVKRGLETGLGDEGGFAPNLQSNTEAFDLLVEAIEKAGYEAGGQIAICFDAAASEFFDKEEGVYHFDGALASAQDMTNFYEGLLDKYPIASIEDPFDENAWDDFRSLTARVGDKVQIMGDDIFVTNPKFITRAIAERTANSTLIKLNQIGTVTETLDAIRLANRNGLTTMVSHRSGETPDSTIADLAVATNAMQLKSGAPARGERVAKYNQLLRIEEGLGNSVEYAGRNAFPQFAA